MIPLFVFFPLCSLFLMSALSTSENSMEFTVCILISAVILFHDIKSANALLKYGSCSKSCSANQSNDLITTNSSYACSCSPSCVHYGDCCFDSPYRTNLSQMKKLRMACLPVEDNGSFEIIVSCSPKWNGSVEFCHQGIGNLPPVSSLSTGATYANIFCALCNEDGEQTTTWNVELKCCSNKNGGVIFHNINNKSTEPGLYLRDNAIWRRKRIGAFMSECECKFKSKVGESFVRNQTELRKCYDTKDISTCSVYWNDPNVRQYCESYIDPVYIQNRVYRNLHCATCNYQIIDRAECIPSVMSSFDGSQMNAEEVRKYCEKHRLSSCVHYISRAKGRPSRFSALFSPMLMHKCIPPRGRRCCVGERFDFRFSKTCKKM